VKLGSCSSIQHTYSGLYWNSVLDYMICHLDDCVHSRKGKKLSIKILQRFHFSSALKRMATVCNILSGTGGTQYIAVVKGAAEVIRPMVQL